TFVLKYHHTLEDACDTLADLLNVAQSTLKRFDCTVLGVSDDGLRCTHIELLSYLLNNNHRSIPLTSSKAVDIIGHSDWHFGYDMLEIRNADSEQSKYAVFYELDSFPISTERGMWDFLLRQQCEFVLTQSMILMKSASALKAIDAQANLIASSDNAEHELAELALARDYTATGEISFGDYHCSLAVFSDSQQGAMDDGADVSSEFSARGTLLKRANLASQFSFLSMMPAAKQRLFSAKLRR
ncbi:conjugal transfer protein TraE, partial [Photobacterium indicum]